MKAKKRSNSNLLDLSQNPNKRRPLFDSHASSENVARATSAISKGRLSNTNPFQQRWSRFKTNVVNAGPRKGRASPSTSASTSAPVISSQKSTLGHEIRARALSIQLKARDSANLFRDKRIGESQDLLNSAFAFRNTDGLGDEQDRYLARFQKQRAIALAEKSKKRLAKKAKFNIGDSDDDHNDEADDEDDHRLTENIPHDDDKNIDYFDDQDDFILTHNGRKLQLESESDNEVLDKDVRKSSEFHLNDPRNSDQDFDTTNLNFGGGFVPKGGSAEEQEKTRQEIMSEIIAKSKKFKAEKQKEKEQMVEKTRQLDLQLSSVLKAVSKKNIQTTVDSEILALETTLAPSLSSAKQAKVILPLNRSGSNDHNPEHSTKKIDLKAILDFVDPNDPDVLYDKLLNELAMERKAAPTSRLKTQEEVAQEEKEKLEELEKQRRLRKKFLTSPSTKSANENGVREYGGDELDDGFDLDEDQKYPYSGSSSDGDDDGVGVGHDDNGDQNDQRNDSDKLNKIQVSNILSSDEESQDQDSGPDDNSQAHQRTLEDIPYVFTKCPENYPELKSLFKNLNPQGKSLVIERLEKCFAPSLDKSRNVPKIKLLLSLLVNHLDNLIKSKKYSSDVVEEYNRFVPFIYSLAVSTSSSLIVTTWARSHIAEIFHRITKSNSPIRSLDLVFLNSLGQLFPVTDLRHNVLTPAIIILNLMLQRPEIENIEDWVQKAFAVSCLSGLLAPEHRISGQLILFLALVFRKTAESTMTSTPSKKSEKSSSIETLAFDLSDHQCKADGVDTSIITTGDQLSLDMCDKVDSSHKECVLKILKGLLKVSLGLAADLEVVSMPCASVILEPLTSNLSLLSGIRVLDTNVKTAVESVLNRINSTIKACEKSRKPLEYYHKPVPLPKMYNPKFPEVSTGSKRKSEQDELRLLKKQVRKEERGAARELRQDARFISEVRLQNQLKEDAIRQQNSNEVMAFLENQQRTYKEQVKLKKKATKGKW